MYNSSCSVVVPEEDENKRTFPEFTAYLFVDRKYIIYKQICYTIIFETAATNFVEVAISTRSFHVLFRVHCPKQKLDLSISSTGVIY